MGDLPALGAAHSLASPGFPDGPISRGQARATGRGTGRLGASWGPAPSSHRSPLGLPSPICTAGHMGQWRQRLSAPPQRKSGRGQAARCVSQAICFLSGLGHLTATQTGLYGCPPLGRRRCGRAPGAGRGQEPTDNLQGADPTLQGHPQATQPQTCCPTLGWAQPRSSPSLGPSYPHPAGPSRGDTIIHQAGKESRGPETHSPRNTEALGNGTSPHGCSLRLTAVGPSFNQQRHSSSERSRNQTRVTASLVRGQSGLHTQTQPHLLPSSSSWADPSPRVSWGRGGGHACPPAAMHLCQPVNHVAHTAVQALLMNKGPSEVLLFLLQNWTCKREMIHPTAILALPRGVTRLGS